MSDSFANIDPFGSPSLSTSHLRPPLRDKRVALSIPKDGSVASAFLCDYYGTQVRSESSIQAITSTFSPPDALVAPGFRLQPSFAMPSLATGSSTAVIADLKSNQNNGRHDAASRSSGMDKMQPNVDDADHSNIPGEGTNDDSDADEEVEDLDRPLKLSERERARTAAFDSWCQDYCEKQAKTNAATSSGTEEAQSTRWLIKQAESERIISSPREYQLELFERAKERNIIAVLDTGSGKTLIAVLLLRHVLEHELEDRAIGKPKRVAFFLVDSVQLIFQQFAVLECNLNHPMERFCGQMGCDLWNRQKWEKIFAENMVIVCTAEVLRNCLHHSFISMHQINILIFDEAHHAKKDHPYARIIKDFYAQEEDKTKRPKIFGMTASPVDTRLDVQKAANELEAILHCQIATAADPSLLQYINQSKSEQVAMYGSLEVAFESPLYQRVKNKLRKNPIFKKILVNSKEASGELGSWCSDRSWRFFLSEQELRRLEAKTEKKFIAQRVAKPLEAFEAQIVELREAGEIIEAHTFVDPEPTLEHLSTKVIVLMEYLKTCFERTKDYKCIVFVTKRHTARLLAELFSHPNIGTPNLQVGYLLGGSGADIGDLQVSFRQQVLTLTKFRKGYLNCLFATSVAEEGLDIPDCNLVIRFDLYSTLIQYIQSRGRARQPNSRYIHMIEEGNRSHAALIREVFKNEGILREFCNSLPADRLLIGNDFDMDYFLAKEKTHRVYKEPTTGAKLNYKMSLLVLANFVSSLPQSPETALNPEYVMTAKNKQFLCEVILPETSPVRGAIGRPASNKQIAKCSAAFEACLMLRKGRYLDEHLLSTYVKQLPAMRNAHLAVSSKKLAAYHMRTKPQLWSANTVPEILYLTVIRLADPASLTRPCQPLGLLTRSALPQLPDIPLFLRQGKKSEVLSTSIANSMHVEMKTLSLINDFTLRVFVDIFSKDYESDLAKMPYFLVPIRNHTPISNRSSPLELIAWDILEEVQAHSELYWTDGAPDEFFENRYIADPHDGSRKFWSTKVAPQYKASDPVPPDTAPIKVTRKNIDNILEYSCSLWAKSRARRDFRLDQPVFEAEYIPLRRNLLDDSDFRDPKIPKQCFLVPEPLKISALPTTIVVMGYLFPSIIHRVESYLIAVEACGMLNLDIGPGLALEALTKDSDNSEEHGGDQIRFQRGMGKNYERLEFLGDSFLKMATTISLFSYYAGDNESVYHVKRMLMISNKNLLNVSLKLKLYEYIRSQSFNRRAWYPEGLVMKRGKRVPAPSTHNLSDKSIADVSEALIGAALLTPTGPNGFDNAVKAVTEVVCSTDHISNSYEDYYKSYEKPTYQKEPSTAGQRLLAAQVELKHLYHFRYPRLLRSAFTHPSYPFIYERVPNYQRLEFLGDSLLDMVCIRFLFDRFPDQNPQWLTEHKMAMVSNQFYGALCVSLGFYKYLLQFSSDIQKRISDYVADINETRLEAEQEALAAGKPRENYSLDYWLNTKEPPKCLPDMVEAYVGAIFVDSEYNYAEVERFFDQHIRPYFEDISLYDTFANKHPVTFLTKVLNIQMGCNNWNIYARQLPDLGDGLVPPVVATVMVHNRVIMDHQGASARYAKVTTAKKALELLAGLGLPDFRAHYECDCKPPEESKNEVEGEELDKAFGTAT